MRTDLATVILGGVGQQLVLEFNAQPHDTHRPEDLVLSVSLPSRLLSFYREASNHFARMLALLLECKEDPSVRRRKRSLEIVIALGDMFSGVKTLKSCLGLLCVSFSTGLGELAAAWQESVWSIRYFVPCYSLHIDCQSKNHSSSRLVLQFFAWVFLQPSTSGMHDRITADAETLANSSFDLFVMSGSSLLPILAREFPTSLGLVALPSR